MAKKFSEQDAKMGPERVAAAGDRAPEPPPVKNSENENDDEYEGMMVIARKVMRRHAGVLRELAKS